MSTLSSLLNTEHRMRDISSNPEMEKQIVRPALQWAESLNNVYIEVKFAGKMSHAAYTDIRNHKIEFTDNGIMNLSAQTYIVMNQH